MPGPDAQVLGADFAAVDLETRDVDVQTHASYLDPGYSEKCTFDDPYSGSWIDIKHSFFDGAVIDIGRNSWRPRHCRNAAHEDATYRLADAGDAKRLVEERQDGQVRHFIVKPTSGGALRVDFQPDSEYTTSFSWMLVRQKCANTDLGKILSEKTRNSHVRFYFDWSWSSAVRNARVLVSNDWFDSVMGLVIFVNSICVGIEIELDLQKRDKQLIVYMEYIFLLSYSVELWLRWLGKSPGMTWKKFWIDWMLFDVAVVIVGVLSLLASEIIPKSFGVVRVLRLLRLVRIVRRVMTPLWQLINGLRQAIPTLSWTFCLILFFCYVFACFFTSADCSKDVFREKFSSVPLSFLTMFQFTVEELEDIMFPLASERPASLFVFFLAYVIITILIMNLVTAAVVEGAVTRATMDQKSKDARMKRQVDAYQPELFSVFELMDKKERGEIRTEDILKFDINAEEANELRLSEQVKEVLQPETLKEHYDCFDADNSGWVSSEEFVRSCLAVLVSGKPEIVHLLQLIRINSKIQRDILQRLDTLGRDEQLECERTSTSTTVKVPSRPNTPLAWRRPMKSQGLLKL